MKKTIASIAIAGAIVCMAASQVNEGDSIKAQTQVTPNIEDVLSIQVLKQKEMAFEDIKNEAERRAMEKQKLEELKQQRQQEIERQKLEAQRIQEQKRKAELAVKKQKHVTVSRNNNESYINYEGYFDVTFYTAGYESTGKNAGDSGYGVTASGTTVKQGRTAACPKNIPFGTKLYIEGFGYRICEDRGSAINNPYKLDIFVESLNEATRLGRQRIYVKVFN